MITNDRAREIAFKWHGGGGSPLYQFASLNELPIYQTWDASRGRFGWVELVAEVQKLVLTVTESRLKPGATTPYSKSDLRELMALRNYINKKAGK